jgi:hypothetical protein
MQATLTAAVDDSKTSQLQAKMNDNSIDNEHDNNDINNNSNNNKWTHTSIRTRSTITPTDPFFTSLPTRPGYRARHLSQCYLPTAPMCECQRFPILSHQLPSSSTYSTITSLPQELDHLCLCCIRLFCNNKADGVLKSYWTRDLEAVHAAYYEGFYTSTELENIAQDSEDIDYIMQETLDKAIVLCVNKHGYKLKGWVGRYDGLGLMCETFEED